MPGIYVHRAGIERIFSSAINHILMCNPSP